MCMAGFFPGGTESPYLAGLLDMEGFAGLIVLECRRLQVQPTLPGPNSGGIGPRPPPDPVAQAWRVGLHAQQAWRIGKHRLRVGSRETFTAQQVEKHVGVTPAH